MEFDGDFRIRRDRETIVLEIKGVARFAISGGARIDTQIEPEADADVVHAYLLGMAFAFMLSQRGWLVFHGAAAAIGPSGVAILGRRGAGKSTLAAALLRARHALLADDILALEPNGAGAFRIVPGYAQIKVPPNSAFLLEQASPCFERNISPFGKTVARLNRGGKALPVPLVRAYILEQGEETSLEAIAPMDAAIELAPHWFPTQYGKDAILALGPQRLLGECAALARTARVRRLRRPMRFDSLEGAVAAIEHDLAIE
ncbi:MAG: hypothetical protein BWZ10_01573 [candidate division BRC1 bacterium ADurb.BinA364]|nr:MAG: hypothetical protein BWZ10_01573 [candidate division BRC1 bacterium ADurb.BinA364]